MGQQIQMMKHKMEDDHVNYKRKILAYQDGQQRQSTLIQKLQNKVLQYKRKNGEQETLITENTAEIEKLQNEMKMLNSTLKQYEEQFQSNENEQNDDLSSTLVLLEEERQRNGSLQHVNNMLREQ